MMSAGILRSVAMEPDGATDGEPETSLIEHLVRAARAAPSSIIDLAEAVPQQVGLTLRVSSRGFTQYPDTRGIEELRSAITERENAKYGLKLSSDHVVVTNGATEAINLVLHAILRPHDRVFIQSPALDFYRALAQERRAHPVALHTPWQDAAPFRRARVPRVCIVHNPSNPTGVVIPEKVLSELRQQCMKVGTVLVVDQMYDELLFEIKRPQESQDMIDSGFYIKVNSASKAFGAPGVRLGWIVCKPDFAKKLAGLAERLRISVSILSQNAGLSLLRNPLDRISKHLLPRRARIRSFLELPIASQFRADIPRGGVCFWVEILDRAIDSDEFCRTALKDARVLLFPGTAFWGGGSRHFRLSFGAGPRVLAAGVRQLSKLLVRQPWRKSAQP